MPLSLTEMRNTFPSTRAARRMRPGGSVYLAALFSTLAKACDSRSGSASSSIAPSGRTRPSRSTMQKRLGALSTTVRM